MSHQQQDGSGQPCDPVIHRTAIKMARRCVWIIQAVLREEEVIEATREFYEALRKELESFARGQG
jgi:hypothetical protein